jgi:formylglycine-generating enzyme required for sulfatase activity
VETLDWYAAMAFCDALSSLEGSPAGTYGLPTEAEWEYAARAGTLSRYPWGDAPDDACDTANLYDLSAQDSYAFGWAPTRCRDNYPDVAPVGALRANGFGLHDMIGNVAEWVEDCYTDSYVGRPRDGRAWVWSGGCGRHVVRGGSWASSVATAGSASREAEATDFKSDFIGFRVAVDLDGRGEGR